mmetsp:Transcript_105543/g.265801  ORF Transcript_105543/g.265801 Transcript_105543/m.265801 type:complete len:179 (+) Transcript_105543:67-603(+)
MALSKTSGLTLRAAGFSVSSSFLVQSLLLVKESPGKLYEPSDFVLLRLWLCNTLFCALLGVAGCVQELQWDARHSIIKGFFYLALAFCITSGLTGYELVRSIREASHAQADRAPALIFAWAGAALWVATMNLLVGCQCWAKEDSLASVETSKQRMSPRRVLRKPTSKSGVLNYGTTML